VTLVRASAVLRSDPSSPAASGAEVSTTSLLGVVSGATVVGAVSGAVDSVVDGSVSSGSVEATLTVNSTLLSADLPGTIECLAGLCWPPRRPCRRSAKVLRRSSSHGPATSRLADTTLPCCERDVVVRIRAAEAT
jgi:hypothetical protein